MRRRILELVRSFGNALLHRAANTLHSPRITFVGLTTGLGVVVTLPFPSSTAGLGTVRALEPACFPLGWFDCRTEPIVVLVRCDNAV